MKLINEKLQKLDSLQKNNEDLKIEKAMLPYKLSGELHFKLINEKLVEIICGKRTVGRILTPGGTSGKYNNSIQVCGFDEAFNLWGCGVFGEEINPVLFKGEKEPKLNIHHKRDINLLFSDYQSADNVLVSNHGLDFGKKMVCLRCFNNPCDCHLMKLKEARDIFSELWKIGDEK